MLTAIIQPNFLPWRGYFDIIDQVDTFVLLDTVQYTRQSWRNRNRIKTSQGVQWINVPVSYAFSNRTHIVDVPINKTIPWKRKLFCALQSNYGRAKYFPHFFPKLCSVIDAHCTHIADLDLATIRFICDIFTIKTTLVRASDLPVDAPEKQARLLAILKYLGATDYVTGPAARSYMTPSLYAANTITLHEFVYNYEAYPQLYGPFEPSLSIIDLLFNCGPDGRKFLRSNTPMRPFAEDRSRRPTPFLG